MAHVFLIAFYIVIIQVAATSSNTNRCNIDYMPVSSLINSNELPSRPVIYYDTDGGNRNNLLSQLVTRNYLLENYASTMVTLSSSNAYSHGRYRMTLGEYILSSVDVSSQHANETLYMFGNNYDGVWKELSDMYEVPPCRYCEVAGAKTIGLGGHASGVSFHYHGPGYAEVIVGRKRWFLFPAEFTDVISKKFNPNMTVAQWVDQVYPLFNTSDPHLNLESEVTSSKISVDSSDNIDSLSDIISESMEQVMPLPQVTGLTETEIKKLGSKLLECVLGPGEILYFPSMWMHATLNLDPYNVFFSLFLDTQLMK